MSDFYCWSLRPSSWRKKRIHFHDFMLDVHSRLPVRKNIWFQTWDQWVYLCLYRGGHPTTNLISPFAQKIELWEFWCSRYVFLNHYRMTLEFTHYIHTFLYLIHSSTWWAASLYLGLNTGSDMEKVISVGREMIFNILQLQKHKGVADPLEVVAAEISDEAILLCLDEFMVCHQFMICHLDSHCFRLLIISFCLILLKVTDVADASLLNRLFRHLFSTGSVSIWTFMLCVSYLLLLWTTFHSKSR